MTLEEASKGEVTSGRGTYNIGFDDGDETQFDAQNLEELQECWSEFCKEEKIDPGCVDYVERVPGIIFQRATRSILNLTEKLSSMTSSES